MQADYVRLLGGAGNGLNVSFAAAPDYDFVLPLTNGGSGWVEAKGGIGCRAAPFSLGLSGQASVGDAPLWLINVELVDFSSGSKFRTYELNGGRAETPSLFVFRLRVLAATLAVRHPGYPGEDRLKSAFEGQADVWVPVAEPRLIGWGLGLVRLGGKNRPIPVGGRACPARCRHRA